MRRLKSPVRSTALVLAICGAATSAALANDTTAELKTGGLAYVQTSDIAMEEEDLFLSREEIRVDYVFRNLGKDKVESLIAFPMPDIVGGSESDIAYGDNESDNFLGFSVVQDGKEITTQLQQRVTALGIDQTERLKAAGVPFLPYSEKTAAALKHLSAAEKAEWAALGLIRNDDFGAGAEVTPVWTFSSAYWWKTTFPAGEKVKVAHRYTPSVGGTVAMSFIEGGKPAYSYEDYAKRYCIDGDFMKTAAKLEAAAARSAGPHYTEQWLSYILTTGGNWAGPIKRFRLTIDKGNPKDFVSFCGKGVKKVGPTKFVMEAEDFTPEREMDVLFLVAGE
ncbi:DUF4424 domain-containing protein [Rhizobium panacihumi]|uniref:DUF4424 domain-containing protein n=1 Tax=Rhizobium panacihumi TaxID=2008450 RepID=UPI003D79D533